MKRTRIKIQDHKSSIKDSDFKEICQYVFISRQRKKHRLRLNIRDQFMTKVILYGYLIVRIYIKDIDYVLCSSLNVFIKAFKITESFNVIYKT